jgi:lysophospholipase L1-like esterase
VVFEVSDPIRGTSLRPFASGWQTTEGSAYVAINSHGYRDRERPTTKPPRAHRIAVLGDSFVEARQLGLNETFCAVLERLLSANPQFSGRPVEVLNFGIAGYGTAQELLTLKKDVFAFQPDHIVLAVFTGNDISDNSRGLSHPMDARPYYELHDDRLVLDTSFLQSPAFRDRQGLAATVFYATQKHLRLVQLAYRARRRLGQAPPPDASEPPSPFNQPGLPHNVYREPANAAWTAAWRVTEALLIEIHEECARKGIPFGVVTLSNPPQVSPDSVRRRAYEQKLGVPDLFYPDRRIKDIGERAGFPVLNLAPLLQTYAVERQVYLHGLPNGERGMGHWNAEGHRVAAELIAPFLQPAPSRLGPATHQ